MNNFILISVALFIILLIGLGYYFMSATNNSNSQTTTNTNSTIPNTNTTASFVLNNDPALKYYYTFDSNDIKDLTLLNRATNSYDGLFSSINAISTSSNIGNGSLNTNKGTTYFTSNYITNFTNAGLSIAFWFNLSEYKQGSGNDVYSITTNPGSASTLMMEIGSSNGTSINHVYCYVYTNNPVDFRNTIPDNTYFKDTWIHLCVVFGTSAQLYFNGKLLSDQKYNFNGITFPTGTKFTIGADSPTNNFWSGYVDDFRIYNRVLTQSEITLLYNYKNN